MRSFRLVVLSAFAIVPCLVAQQTPTVPAAHQRAARPLPVRYLADRFAVTPVSERGDTLVLYTDTGGGTSRLWPETVRRLGLVAESVAWGRDTLSVVALPRLINAATIPPPTELPPIGERLLVTTVSRQFGRDGFLGRMWFAGRVWVLDYPRQSLALLPAGAAHAVPTPHMVPLGFQRDSGGRYTRHFPRIRVAVDGDSLDLLFDTGATVSLSDSARVTLASRGFAGPAERGTSFIAQDVFERWRTRHPDWRVIERADLAFESQWPIIEVPLLAVAGYEVGPVWFTMRPTQSFQGMSTAMDAPVQGALGGVGPEVLSDHGRLSERNRALRATLNPTAQRRFGAIAAAPPLTRRSSCRPHTSREHLRLPAR